MESWKFPATWLSFAIKKKKIYGVEVLGLQDASPAVGQG
jgi:hypothetical protein